MRNIFALCLSLLSLTIAWAQVPKRVVVEHFTNTRCSICAQTNPGFYNNLKNHPDVLHLAIHPSAPYNACYLHGLNPTENDARTNYYNAYGATPRFFIQGTRDPNANTSNPSFFSPHTGQLSPVELKIEQFNLPNDSFEINISILKIATDTFAGLRLFVALAQDSVLYAGPNGENLHQDVFIRALSNINGDALNLPANIGDSLIFTYTGGISDDWINSRVFGLAILQEENNKKVVQANATNSMSSPPLGIKKEEPIAFSIYPNPGNGQLFLDSKHELDVTIYLMNGSIVKSLEYAAGSPKLLDVELDPGLYFLEVMHGNRRAAQKVIVR